MKAEEELRQAFVRIKNFVEETEKMGIPVTVHVTLEITVADRSTRIEVRKP